MIQVHGWARRCTHAEISCPGFCCFSGHDLGFVLNGLCLFQPHRATESDAPQPVPLWAQKVLSHPGGTPGGGDPHPVGRRLQAVSRGVQRESGAPGSCRVGGGDAACFWVGYPADPELGSISGTASPARFQESCLPPCAPRPSLT